MAVSIRDKRNPVVKFGNVPNDSLFSLWNDYDEHDDGGVYVKLHSEVVDAEDTELEYNSFDFFDCVLRKFDENDSVLLINDIEIDILR